MITTKGIRTVFVFIGLKIAELLGVAIAIYGFSIIGEFIYNTPLFYTSGVTEPNFFIYVFLGVTVPFIVITTTILIYLALYQLIKKNIEWAKSISNKLEKK